GELLRSRARIPLRPVALAAVKGSVMDPQAGPAPEQVREFCVLGPVERINAQQELIVAGGEDGPPECDRRRADRQLAAEHIDARLAELPEWLAIQRQDSPGDDRRPEAGIDELQAC